MPTVISMKKPILYFLQNKQGKKWHISVRENTLISQIVTGYFFDKRKIKYRIKFCKHSQGKPNQQMHDNLLHITLVSASWERLNTVRRVLQIHIKGVLLCSTHSRRAQCKNSSSPTVSRFVTQNNKLANNEYIKVLYTLSKPNVQLKEDKSRLNIVSYTMCPYGSERSAFFFSARSKINLEIQ